MEKGARSNSSIVLDIAHRGASALAPENTKSSFLEALKNGADAVELDIHLTKDKKLVVIHDSTINRTSNGYGLVSRMTLAELQKYDFGMGGIHEKILTLEEALKIIGDRSHILIEPKYSTKGFEHLIIAEINKAKSIRNKHQIWVHSMHKSILQKLRKLDPSLRLGYILVFSVLHKFLLPFYRWWVKKYRISFFSISNIFPNTFFTDRFVKELGKMKVEVYIWVVNDLNSLHYALKSGVRGIITNYPGVLKTIMHRYFR